ncbi:hypothetical protein GCM10027064_11540 [Microbacterium petrolearium]
MTFLSDFQDRAGAVASLPPVDVAVVAALPDEDVLALLTVATDLAKTAERVRAVAAGVVSARSSRAAGHKGLAQGRGHRNAVALVQELSGSTRGDAARQVRVGQSLVESALGPGAAPDGPSPADPADPDAPNVPPAPPWHDPVDQALLSGAVTAAQMDAILRGLGQPPTGSSQDSSPASADAAVEAWRLAAEQLVAVAAECTVEDLATAARVLRDRLDPEGAEARFLARFEARSFRMWTDADGIAHAKIVFDDDGAAWMRAVIDAALRPRRGGPRFVDADEAAKAQQLTDDPRTNDQLTYDLILGVLRAGAVADAETVFGARQPGVRVVTIDPTRHVAGGGGTGDGAPSGTAEVAGNGAGRTGRTGPIPWPGPGYTEDGGHPLPTPAVEQAICTTGHTPVTVDAHGNPLDVGREQRLFTPKQRIALAIRDGGCRWRGCGMPASYCEAHHIDTWAAHGGRTDTDRGILLCRFHHMNLHHHRFRITRDRHGPFLLHPPDSSEPTELPTRSPLRWALGPPPRAA